MIVCHVHACVLAVKCDSVVGPALLKLLECWLIASESPARVRLVVRSQHYPVVLASKIYIFPDTKVIVYFPFLGSIRISVLIFQ